jgi:phosphoglycerol transferase MdoB-like AlkP superfamily enzyme
MRDWYKRIFGTSEQGVSTWRYHLWVSLFLFFTVSTFGWNYEYFHRSVFLVQRYPLHLLPNWMMVVALSFFFALFIKHKLFHFVTLFALFYTFATATRLKFESIGMPLLAVDLKLAKYSDVLLSYVSPAHVGGVVIAILLVLAVFTFHTPGKSSLFNRLIKYPHLLKLERRTLLCALLTLPIWYGLVHNGRFHFFGLKLYSSPHVPVSDYMGDGDIVAFTLSIYSNRNHLKRYQIAPETLKLLQDSPAVNNIISDSCLTEVQPDILVVMVESMFDPVQIPTIRLSSDPLAPLRNLGFEETSSYFFVPSYGGQTANTEFEFLTGSTHRFFPTGTVQYQSHLYHPANSVASMLKHKDYRSIAVHNYKREFWRRHEVYPLMGFDEYFGLEDIQTQTKVKRYENGKPDDRSLPIFVPNLMREHESNPGFYFVVTMGTHGPYEVYLSEASNKISITSDSGLREKSLVHLKNYSNFLADSSSALGDLFRFALGRSKPTVVVYFSDHLPGLPREAYQKTGYFDWMKREVGIDSDTQKIVPVRVINNFGCKLELPKAIASNCIAAHLVSQLYSDLPQDAFWKYNLEFCKKHPFVFDGIDPSKLSGDFADYAALIYKNLFEWKPAKLTDEAEL